MVDVVVVVAVQAVRACSESVVSKLKKNNEKRNIPEPRDADVSRASVGGGGVVPC